MGGRCWVLGVGCWVLGVGCWVLGEGYWRAFVAPASAGIFRSILLQFKKFAPQRSAVSRGYKRGQAKNASVITKTKKGQRHWRCPFSFLTASHLRLTTILTVRAGSAFAAGAAARRSDQF